MDIRLQISEVFDAGWTFKNQKQMLSLMTPDYEDDYYEWPSNFMQECYGESAMIKMGKGAGKLDGRNFFYQFSLFNTLIKKNCISSCSVKGDIHYNWFYYKGRARHILS